MLEDKVFQALKDLVSGRVYADVAPQNAVRPFITYQQVGGQSPYWLEAVPVARRNARMQINVWHNVSRRECAILAKQAEDALVSSTKAVPLAAMVASYDPDAQVFGTRQDFSVWD